MPCDIKEGDKVQLKSGGPSMTVEWIERQIATCAWFEKERLEQHSFALESLERVLSGNRAASAARTPGPPPRGV
jgi:uncharacterized protein YodC (DUF2158 family)